MRVSDSEFYQPRMIPWSGADEDALEACEIALRPELPALDLDQLSRSPETEDSKIHLQNIIMDRLESNPRLLLYLPMAILPEGNDPRIRQSVLPAYSKLARFMDVEENFKTGNVVEAQLRDGEPNRAAMIHERDDDLTEHGILPGVARPRVDIVPDFLPRSLDEILVDLNHEIESFTPDEPHLSERRTAWLERRHTARAIGRAARELTASISDDDYPIELDDILNAAASASYSLTQKEVLVETAKRSFIDFRTVLDPVFLQIFNRTMDQLHSQLPSSKEHVNVLGRIAHISSHFEDPITGFTGQENKLHLPPHKRLEYHSPELIYGEQIIRALTQTEIYKKTLFPTIAMTGSRVKGYGGPDSDFDFAVFLRPGVTEHDRALLKEEYKKTMAGHEIEPIEYAFDENMRLAPYQTEATSNAPGDNTMFEVPLSGFWLGTDDATTEVQDALRAQLQENAFIPELNAHVGSIALETLERTLLQYRLLHRGYASLLPVRKRVGHDDIVRTDGETVWHDEGFQRIATTIFLTQIKISF